MAPTRAIEFVFFDMVERWETATLQRESSSRLPVPQNCSLPCATSLVYALVSLPL